MFYSYLLSVSALAAVSLGTLLYMGAGQHDWIVEGAQAPTSADRRPEHLSARYREQMKLTQETLRDFGYAPGPSDGVMGFSTASALRAFQRREGLRVTGRANPETLAALGIEDRLSRRTP
jgi:peptidoglycan hydrolase-like protein with peptidoglycan-binding domain